MVGMVAFATPEQMEARTQGAIPASHPALVEELDAASRAIRNACGWHIAPVLEVTRKSRSPHWGEIWVPAMEISAVTITTPDGVETVLADDEFDPETGWTAWSGDRYTLTFTAGFAEIPADLVTLTLQVAARALGSPLGLVREQAGSVSVTHSQPGFNVAGGTVLLDHERAQLAPYILGRLP